MCQSKNRRQIAWPVPLRLGGIYMQIMSTVQMNSISFFSFTCHLHTCIQFIPYNKMQFQQAFHCHFFHIPNANIKYHLNRIHHTFGLSGFIFLSMILVTTTHTSIHLMLLHYFVPVAKPSFKATTKPKSSQCIDVETIKSHFIRHNEWMCVQAARTANHSYHWAENWA